jgi:hypothetical protein
MKLIISTIPMKSEVYRHHYPVNGNRGIEYEGEVLFPVNAVLAKTLKKGERGKVVFLSTSGGGDNHSAGNMEKFRAELDALNNGIGARLSYEVIETPFDPQKEVFEQLIGSLVSRLGQKAQIIADITFGIKPLPMILFCALNFAEKFYSATVEHIIYGKVEFTGGKTLNPMIYDLTPLYYLNKLIGSMECKTAASAVELLNEFFAM